MSDEKILDSSFGSEKSPSFEDKKNQESSKGEFSENENESVIFSPEKEVSSEITGAEKDSAYGKILSKVKDAEDKDDELLRDVETILQKKMDAESNVKHLVDLALEKGVEYAVKVARKMDDNYILDMMHDKLIADNFHKALLDKRMISEE